MARDMYNDHLLAELDRLLVQIDKQIRVVNLQAEGEGVHPSTMRYASGEFILAPLLSAKANTILAITHIKLIH